MISLIPLLTFFSVCHSRSSACFSSGSCFSIFHWASTIFMMHSFITVVLLTISLCIHFTLAAVPGATCIAELCGSPASALRASKPVPDNYLSYGSPTNAQQLARRLPLVSSSRRRHGIFLYLREAFHSFVFLEHYLLWVMLLPVLNRRLSLRLRSQV